MRSVPNSLAGKKYYNSADEVPYTITVVLNPKVTKEGSAELAFDQNT